MRRLTCALSLLLFALSARGDCTGPTLSINAADQTIGVQFTDDIPAVMKNDKVKIAIGSTVLDATVQDISTIDVQPKPITIIDLGKPDAAKFEDGTLVLDAELTNDSAKMTYTDQGKEKSVDLCLVGQFNTSSQSIHVGPTVGEGGESTDATVTDESKPGAIRLQIERSYRRFREVKSNAGSIPSMRNMQQEYSISIDTTDRKGKGFIDDNHAMVGVFSPRKTFGGVLNRVRIGAVGQFAQALHSHDQNRDLKLSVDGWIPPLRAISIGSGRHFIASPLSFRLSAGQRWQDVENVRSHGRLAEWSFLYHAYLPLRYRLDLEHKTTFNDVSDRPTSTPRTQHAWKATLLYSSGTESKFDAVASYEDGHSGPVFTKLRQFYVGVGLKGLFGSITP